MSALKKTEFNVEEIYAQLRLNGESWIHQIEHHAQLDSSNTYLMRADGSIHGRLCIVDYQSNGRGRRGKSWQSEPGCSLMFSLGYEPQDSVNAELSLIIGVAIADVLEKLGVSEVSLKWPNDVLLDGKKLAGVLLESRFLGNKNELVIGVGVNVDFSNEQLSEIQTPSVSLAQLDLNAVNKQAILIELVRSIMRRLDQFELEGFAPIRLDWLNYQTQSNEDVNFQFKGSSRIGRVEGLDGHGRLLIKSNGELLQVLSGEVNTIRASE